jgi:thiol-disulfide isomerase/thioredoxin
VGWLDLEPETIAGDCTTMKHFLIALFLLLVSLPTLSAGLKAVTPKPAPVLPFSLLNGQSLDIGKLRGQVVLVNFWATWCPPCRKEMPSLDRLDKMESGRRFTVLAVNVKEQADLVERFLDEMPLSFPIALDEDGKLAKAWKAYVYPTSYLVDKTGQIRYSLSGTLEWDDPEVVELIEQLMLEKSAAPAD